MPASLAVQGPDHKFADLGSLPIDPKSCACHSNSPMNARMMKNGTVTPDLPAANPAGSAAIEAAHLVKLYKTTRAVDDVSFRIARCSITGLLGGNGAAQTTTTPMIIGPVLPRSGRLQVPS